MQKLSYKKSRAPTGAEKFQCLSITGSRILPYDIVPPTNSLLWLLSAKLEICFIDLPSGINNLEFVLVC